MQKKWVELFEKVIGRKPSPEEFMAGKACGFDLKQIQSIAGNAPEAVSYTHLLLNLHAMMPNRQAITWL